jgi:beta-RFAP synthase
MPKQSLGPAEGACDAVEVLAPARLHLGFLDLHGGLGRRFGSIGVALDGIGTRLTLARRAGAGAAPERARRLVGSLAGRLGVAGPLDLTLNETIPEHVGLGSGTQLGLALAAALASLAGRPVDARALAPLVERGARSGIGIGAFAAGGFLVDGGKGDGSSPAPIVARADFPPAWRLILLFDSERHGLSGEAEKVAFQALPAFPEADAARLCRLVLMRLLPGLAEDDFAAVAEAIGEINARIGDHFAPAQGGRYASPRIGEMIDWLRRSGFAGVGQSSWGPTGFVLVATDAEAERLRDRLAARYGGDGLAFRICAGRNRGADVIRRSAAPDGG